MDVKSYIKFLSSRGKHFFTTGEALHKTGLSKEGLEAALRRLKKKGEIASPMRGFFLIVPPEYYSLGSLPPEQFIDNLMAFLQIPYYVAFLSAAHFYGAAHQKPQTLQVVTPKRRRNIKVGRVTITFVTKSNAAQMPTQLFNTESGYVRVATPEIVALDVVTFPHYATGISEAFNIISELSEKLKLNDWVLAIQSIKHAPPLQRLGHFFERLEMKEFAKVCESELKKHSYVKKALLDPFGPADGLIEKKWNLIININLEAELDI